MYNKKFRYLHLSDLHCFTDSKEPNQVRMKRELLRILPLQNGAISDPLDCIVITGDFFSKGTFSFDALKSFLEELYLVCSEKSGWNWQKGQPMDRIFFCPGNHDLNRNVSCHEDCMNGNAKAFPRVYSRSTVLKEFVNKHPDQFPDSPEDKCRLLTTESFWQFSTAMENLCGYPDKNSKFKNECNVFHISSIKTPDPIVFVGVNTELYAGQIRATDVIRSELSNAYKKYLDAHNALDFEKASQTYQEYTRLMDELGGDIAKDDEHLCFISRKAKQYAETQIEEKTRGKGIPLIIKFGHRSLNSLTRKAQQHLAEFAHSDDNLCEVYLCGHSHTPGARDVSVDVLNGNAYQLSESTVGGIFADSSKYNSCSFMVGEIVWAENNRTDILEITPTLHQTFYLWVERYNPRNIGKYQNTPNNRPYAWESIKLTEVKLRTYNSPASNIQPGPQKIPTAPELEDSKNDGKIPPQNPRINPDNGKGPETIVPSSPTKPDPLPPPIPPHSAFPDF